MQSISFQLFAQQPALPETGDQSGFGTLNWIVFLSYLFLLALIGWWFRNRDERDQTYFDGGRKMPWWVAGLSIYATHQSAVTCMGIPAKAYGSNWAIFLGYLTIPPAAILSAYFFAKEFRRADVATCYEYLEVKFDRWVRRSCALLFVLLHIGKLGIFLFFPAMAVSVAAGIDIYLAITLVGGVVTAYTAIGGIRSVIWSDFLQVLLMTGGAITCICFIAYHCGGFQNLIETASNHNKFQIISLENGTLSKTTWIILIGGFLTSMYSFSSEQTVVQRYFVTENLSQTIRSCWLNSLFLVPAAALFFFLGTSLWVFYSSGGTEIKVTEKLVPQFILANLPPGIAGLGIAGLMAAAMSSLDSSINSITAVLWNDFGKGKSQKRVDQYQLTSLLLGLIAIGSASFVALFQSKSTFDLFIELLSCFAGVIFALFLFARFSKTPQALAGKVGLVTGILGNILAVYWFEIGLKDFQLAIVGFVCCLIPAILISLLQRQGSAMPSESTT